ncbi:FecR domain-containing protein [Roseomonas sp. GC11]|uniref:FecR family protein n=1 Tax=Roseomonas sp. GC11 TaxID=2950546 RepID=UPI002109DCA2|nr:FecR domain-containing protein [Roseomonas sp. GC11]MCQ4161669.1 FecR domain-containing protein [Roseomonas sp. GC11]
MSGPDEALRQEAELWLARQRRGLSAPERRAFATWQEQGEAARRAFREAESLWHLAEGPGQRIAAEEAPRLEGWLAAIQAERRRRGRRRLGAATLGALALALGGGGLWLERPGLWQDLLADLRTGRGERRLLPLPDGSSALLDADSALALDFGTAERRVTLLRGAAFFTVRPAAESGGRPFVAETAPGSVRVLGTRFEVRLVGGEAIVTLEEGSVAVTPRGEAGQILRPGERLRFGAGGMARPEAVRLDEALSWREGRFAFQAMPLREVLEEIGRYRPGRILLRDPALGETRVSGSLPLDRPDAALRALQSRLGFRLRVVADRLVLVGE